MKQKDAELLKKIKENIKQTEESLVRLSFMTKMIKKAAQND